MKPQCIQWKLTWFEFNYNAIKSKISKPVAPLNTFTIQSYISLYYIHNHATPLSWVWLLFFSFLWWSGVDFKMSGCPWDRTLVSTCWLKVDVWELRVRVAFLSDPRVMVVAWELRVLWPVVWCVWWDCDSWCVWGRVEGLEWGSVEVGFRMDRWLPLRVREFICGVPVPPGRRSAFL